MGTFKLSLVEPRHRTEELTMWAWRIFLYLLSLLTIAAALVMVYIVLELLWIDFGYWYRLIVCVAVFIVLAMISRHTNESIVQRIEGPGRRHAGSVTFDQVWHSARPDEREGE